MRKYILHVLIISFVFLLTPVTHTAEVSALSAQLEKEILRTSFRTACRTLGNDDIKSILKKYNFFDNIDNENGEFQNDYDLKSINGDKVVIDHATGLMWHQSGFGSIAWSEAKEWVKIE